MVLALQRFRKDVLVDGEGWDLAVENEREADAYDTREATHLALFRDGDVCGTFRATRTDRPYLAADVFPQLALSAAYPHDRDSWEISRFCVSARDRPSISVVTYGVMLWWAMQIQARSLVAVTELAHERLLQSLGIVTTRFGADAIIGFDRRGRPLRAVAGEIPIAGQSGQVMSRLFSRLNHVEFVDASNAFGSSRLSA